MSEFAPVLIWAQVPALADDIADMALTEVVHESDLDLDTAACAAIRASLRVSLSSALSNLKVASRSAGEGRA